jgi:nucleoid DNA-binding protein
MNRGELSRALSVRAGIDRKTADRVIAALFDARHGVGILADALDRGERVVITGFGTFSVRERPGGPSRAPRFRASTPLRERLG